MQQLDLEISIIGEVAKLPTTGSNPILPLHSPIYYLNSHEPLSLNQ